MKEELLLPRPSRNTQQYMVSAPSLSPRIIRPKHDVFLPGPSTADDGNAPDMVLGAKEAADYTARRDLLTPLVDSFKAHVRCAIAYGSSVFPQRDTATKAPSNLFNVSMGHVDRPCRWSLLMPLSTHASKERQEMGMILVAWLI